MFGGTPDWEMFECFCRVDDSSLIRFQCVPPFIINLKISILDAFGGTHIENCRVDYCCFSKTALPFYLTRIFF